MKIKQKNTALLIYTTLIFIFYLYAVSKVLLSPTENFADFTVTAVVSNLIFIVAVLYLYLGTIYGSYLKIEDKQLIRSEGFLKKKFNLETTRKIFCSQHIFLGPSMFVEYQHTPSCIKKKKLLVLYLYKEEDKKILLDFLAKSFPNIQQDSNCENIRKGKEVLTTWRS